MDNQLRKWILVAYAGTAGLVWYVTYQLAFRFASVYDLEARLPAVDLDTVLQISAVVLGAIVFSYLMKSQRVNVYTNEVAVELSRVTWPTISDTQKATVVVMIMVLISGLFLGGLDSFWTWVLKQIF